MGKWSPLSRAPVPLGTPVWQSGWDLGSSPFPPSRLRANLAPHLAQMYPLLPAPHPTSGRALGCYGHPFPTLQSEGPFQNANSTMILPAADPSQGKVQGTGLAFKALHSSAPAHLTPCPPCQPPLYPLPAPQPHLSCQDSPQSLCTSYSFGLERPYCCLLCFSQNTPAQTARPNAEGPSPG